MITLTSTQRTLAEVVAGLVLVGALVGGFIQHERTLGAQKVLLAQEKVRGDSLAKDTVKTRQIAQEAVKQAQAANTAAVAQVAAGRLLQAKTNAAAKSASAERDAANQILADSLATIDALRTHLFNLVVASRADSLAAAHQHTADTLAITGLNH